MKVAVIGAGWAGLAAAHSLIKNGINVDVLEASHTLGGRARTVYNSKLGGNLDNGQHILLGAYNQTLNLMQELGLDTDELFIRKPLHIESIDNRFCLKVNRFTDNSFFSKFSNSFSSDLELLFALLSAKGISFVEKIKMILAIKRLKSNQWLIENNNNNLNTAYIWLKNNYQSENIIQKFWQPLCIAALNTPLQSACPQLFANVLKDSLGAKASDSDILIAKTSLSELWPLQLEKIHIDNDKNTSCNNKNGLAFLAENNHRNAKLNIFTGQNIHELKTITEQYDAVILACNIKSSIRLLSSLENHGNVQNQNLSTKKDIAKTDFLNKLNTFDFNPISTVSLKLEYTWNLPDHMYMLTENRDLEFYGQWLFTNIPAFPNIANIVISDANDAMQHKPEELVKLLINQIKHQNHRFKAMPNVLDYQIITEKRATFYSYPNLYRPSVTTPWSNIFIAGDFTDTGYPAVLEGAVRSGIQAAAACNKH